MDQSAPLNGFIAPATGARRRVRTPGKHIVLFTLAATFMLALSTSAIRSARLSAPATGHTAASDGGLYAPPVEFLVDLSPDRLGRISYLKLDVKIVAMDAAALAEIVEKTPLINERVSFFLRELSPEDFEGVEGMARVKAELLKRVGLPLTPGAARDVVIESIVIQ